MPVVPLPVRASPSPAELARLCADAAGARARAIRVIPSARARPTAVDVAGERLELCPERAVHWPARRTVLVADVHLGKEHVFGRHGIPVPGGISERGLSRLAALVRATRAERLVVLGDLMHDAPVAGDTWPGALSAFLDEHAALRVELCAGNHDRTGAREALDPRLAWLDEPHVDGPFVLRHHPADDPRGYVLCGHVHPAWRLPRRTGAGLRVPAFWFRPGHAVLPAFGEFTGGHAVRAEPGDRVWASGPDRIVPVPLGAG